MSAVGREQVVISWSAGQLQAETWIQTVACSSCNWSDFDQL